MTEIDGCDEPSEKPTLVGKIKTRLMRFDGDIVETTYHCVMITWMSFLIGNLGSALRKGWGGWILIIVYSLFVGFFIGRARKKVRDLKKIRDVIEKLDGGIITSAGVATVALNSHYTYYPINASSAHLSYPVVVNFPVSTTAVGVTQNPNPMNYPPAVVPVPTKKV